MTLPSPSRRDRPQRWLVATAVALWWFMGDLAPAAGQDHEPPRAGQVSVRLLEPPEGLQLGRFRVGAVVSGEGVAQVTFAVDGTVVLRKTAPPFSVEVDLGDQPRMHEIEAAAFSSGGEELARDRLVVNGGPHRFAVRLVQPQEGRTYSGAVEATAEVTLPVGEEVARVEFFRAEEKVGEVDRPPYTLAVPLGDSAEPTYLRAVAHLPDGHTVEDLLFVNTSPSGDRIRVQFVELYATVLDRQRRPIDGLEPSAFAVFEDGRPQEIRRFEQVLDRSVHVGVLIDTSSSMLDELDEAQKAAQQFLEKVVRPRDRATVISFADLPAVRVPFSNDAERLASGLEALEADGETALYDSLAFALYYFGGLRGRRAMVVLTDGADSRSRFQAPEVIEYAQQLGVAIYPIGLNLGTRDARIESHLRRLAARTGGSAFFVQSARELSRVYESIEAELRSQYLIGYQSDQTSGDGFRRIEVKLSQRGLAVRTSPGYFP